jgi:hypothetical protein
MSTFKLVSTTAIAILISTSAWATEHGNKQEPSTMPMMPEGGGMMMDPQMMEKMIPMMNMQMMQRMMQHMDAMEQNQNHNQRQGNNHGMPMMDGGMGNMMMNPQMMQMRMQHMANMEQRLQNIESLLSQLVELQKAK